MFTIMCQVSGGVTGTREALLKNRDGSLVEFNDRDAAHVEAARLNKMMNGSFAAAQFRYWVVEN